MSWTTPKTNWTTADGVDYQDLNRIESNIAFIADNPSGNDLLLAPDGGSVTTLGQTILARDGGEVTVKQTTTLGLNSITSTGNNYDISANIDTSTETGYVRINRSLNTSGLSGLKVLKGDGTSATSITLYGDGTGLFGTTVKSGPKLVVADGVGSLPSISGSTIGLFQNNSSTSAFSVLSLISGNTGGSQINFGDTDDENVGNISYLHSDNYFRFNTNASEAMRLTSANHLLVDTTSDPGETLHIGSGGARFSGTLGNLIIEADGRQITFTRGATNYIWGTTSGSSIAFGTNGLSVSPTNANLLLNADQSVTVNTTLFVDTIAEKTAGNGIVIDGVTLKDNLLPNNQAQIDIVDVVVSTYSVPSGAVGQAMTIFVKNSSGGNLTITLPGTGSYIWGFMKESSAVGQTSVLQGSGSGSDTIDILGNGLDDCIMYKRIS